MGWYGRVFQYLLILKQTQMELEKSQALVMHKNHTNFAKRRHNRINYSISQHRCQGFSSVWCVRDHITFLIRILQLYIQLCMLVVLFKIGVSRVIILQSWRKDHSQIWQFIFRFVNIIVYIMSAISIVFGYFFLFPFYILLAMS